LFSTNNSDLAKGIEISCIIFLLRLLRVLYLLSEIRQFDVILATFLKFKRPFINLFISLYTVYFIFSEVGMFLFGGIITTQSAQVYDPSIGALYYLMNFNDFITAYVTLF
jgi:hypothetical protein